MRTCTVQTHVGRGLTVCDFMQYPYICIFSHEMLLLKTSMGYLGLPIGASGKELPASAEDIRDVGLIPGSGRSLGGGHGHLLQYSCLENPMDTVA